MLVANKPHSKLMSILKAQGRSIYWLANQVDMSYQAIFALVKAEKIPDGTNYVTLRKISDALNVPIDELE